MHRIYKIFITLITIYLLILGLIKISAPDQIHKSFPDDCLKQTNCTRVADFNVRGTDISPIQFNISTSILIGIIFDWVDTYDRSTILYNSSEFIHIKFLTAFFRFPDDFFIKINYSKMVIWMQSQSRLGESDLGVNEDRIQSFYSYMINKV